MCRNGDKKNVREGEIQEWILKASQKKEQGKGTLVNYGKKKQHHAKGKDNTVKNHISKQCRTLKSHLSHQDC